MNGYENKSVAIILLNYNSYDYTEACVNSLKASQYKKYKIVIVDNCSTDDSIQKLRKLESELIHIIISPKNGGFAFGNNIGIEYAINEGFDYFLLLNNDTIVEKDFLDRLVSSACRNASDITTCLIKYFSDKSLIWYAGGDIDWFNQRARHFGINTVYKKELYTEDLQVSFVSGCCMLLSRQCVSKIGKLPEEYFMYYEDLDYCEKAFENNIKLVFCPEAIIYHCISASGGGNNSSFVIEWSNRSRRKFMKKYYYKVILPKRLLSFLFCEGKTIVRILLSSSRLIGLKAYFRSFSKIV